MAQFSGSHSPGWHPHTMSRLGSCNCFLSSSSSPLLSPPLPLHSLTSPKNQKQALSNSSHCRNNPLHLSWTLPSCPFTYQKPVLGLRWWSSGYESVCQCRGHRFDPWSGKTPTRCGAAEPMRLRACAVQQEKPPQ